MENTIDQSTVNQSTNDAAANPYQSPGVDVAMASNGERYQPKILSMHGRIGRIRYLCYQMIVSFVSMLVILPLIGILGGLDGDLQNNPAAWGFIALLYIPIVGASFVFGKRRFNDLNRSGWFMLLLFIPIINIPAALYLLFAKGADEANSYGLPPVENTRGLKILFWLSIIFPIACGIAMAILVPGMAPAA